MKIVKGLAIMSIFTVLFGSCFDPPEFPNQPKISFESIRFHDSPGDGTDSLNLTFTFQDGDGDLGLDPSDPITSSNPFHPNYYFQATGNGQLDTLVTEAAVASFGNSSVVVNILNIDASKGPVATIRTRNEPGYESLPELSCVNYTQYNIVWIEAADTIAFDEDTRYVDTLYSPSTQYYLLSDRLLFKPNENHYNIEVKFYQKSGNDYIEYDWQEKFCIDFSGRFPVLSDRTKALEGQLTYSIKSADLKSLGPNTLKLSVQIKDRALNKSNIMETPEFTLDRIRAN